jgi:hypothetical protein
MSPRIGFFVFGRGVSHRVHRGHRGFYQEKRPILRVLCELCVTLIYLATTDISESNSVRHSLRIQYFLNDLGQCPI